MKQKFSCENGKSFYFEEKIKIIEEELAKILVEARKDIEKLGKHNNKQWSWY